MARVSDTPFLSAVVRAAVVAGVFSSVVQLALWALAGEDPVRNLLRDSRLAAAVLLGPGVLPPPASFDAAAMATATVIHFGLSLIYAALLAPVAQRLPPTAGLAAGALFGAAIYFVNMYGFTRLYPWFAQVRDGVTFATHIAFGALLAGGYRWRRTA